MLAFWTRLEYALCRVKSGSAWQSYGENDVWRFLAPGAPLLSQLIIAGKTPRVLPPHGDDVPPDMCLCCTENHGRSGDSFLEFRALRGLGGTAPVEQHPHGYSYKTWPAFTVRRRHLHALPMSAQISHSVLCVGVELGICIHWTLRYSGVSRRNAGRLRTPRGLAPSFTLRNRTCRSR